MFTLTTDDALRASFRPIDRRHVERAPEVTLPLRVDHYVAWAQGRRMFLVFEAPGGAPRGIAFEANGAGPAVPHMCDWCQQVGLGARVGLLTARRDRKRTLGVMVCADLGCRERIEELADRFGVDVEPALRKVLARMERFAARLGFDPQGLPDGDPHDP